MIYLVRHAHAGSKGDWDGPDTVRPLSAAGRREADGLLVRLRDYPIGRILTSPADRCRQTVEPLASQRGLAIEVDDGLGTDGTAGHVLDLLADDAVAAAVLCTHGEVIGKVFEHLLAGGLHLPDRPRWPKGSTWVLDGSGATVSKASYLEPLRLESLGAG
jgi:8-oxo-dGTP diphosphatase